MKGYMIESDLTQAGTFSSSDEDLNAIYGLNRYTFRCLDMGGYYVDCPHRERLGYGDGQVAVETGIFSFELANFYKKWALNWIYGQSANGEFQHTAPSPYPAGGGPGWGGTGVVLPWKIFKYYGDTTFLDFSYPYMVRYLDFLETKSRNGILIHYGDETWGFIGDWVPPGKGMDSDEKVGPDERELFNNCYKIYLYDIVSECAAVLGREDDSQLFRSRSDTLRQKVHNLYFNNEKGIYANGEQSYLSFPLLLNVPPEVERQRITDNLEHDIRIIRNGHLNTGMLGTYFMLQYLTETGRSDLVYLMMKQKTYPGWGYMISQGATTCWEQWNGYWSNIHSCFTSAGGWFYNGVAGIGQKENSVAFRHMIISPQLTDSIDAQQTEFNSPYGKVLVSWSRGNSRNLYLNVQIPVNTRADIRLPASAEAIVTESGRPLKEIGEIKLTDQKKDYRLIVVPSGLYHFEIRNI
jgi:alpha-L-rhamnosidase